MYWIRFFRNVIRKVRGNIIARLGKFYKHRCNLHVFFTFTHLWRHFAKFDENRRDSQKITAVAVGSPSPIFSWGLRPTGHLVACYGGSRMAWHETISGHALRRHVPLQQWLCWSNCWLQQVPTAGCSTLCMDLMYKSHIKSGLNVQKSRNQCTRTLIPSPFQGVVRAYICEIWYLARSSFTGYEFISSVSAK